MNNTSISLEQVLESNFGYKTFRIGQKEIIMDILNGSDVLGILPTGTGKSICYQLPSLLLSGITIVVSPLISLMMDQVKQLKSSGFKDVVAINSFLDFDQKRYIYQTLQDYKLIFVSPEILQQKELFLYLKQQTISLFVIDEAHCISQWGHEFRPDYQKLNKVLEQLGNPPVLALSATATREVQQDIIKSLERPRMVKHIYPMDRENIMLTIQEVEDQDEKLEVLTRYLSNYKVPTLIYFSSKVSCESVALQLSVRLPNQRIAYYHGGMEQMDRISIQQQFMNEQLDVICCTSAFGMGINKNNIRLVFHYHFPGQIESYIQEIGRAGRDGKESLSVLLYCRRDEALPKQLIQSELPQDEDLRRVFRYIQKEADKLTSLDISDIQTLFEISETQWRFILVQLEKHSISLENVLKYDQDRLDRLLMKIQQVRDKRFKLKMSKYHEMLAWLKTENCLRKELYTKFQNDYTVLEHQCCSNCGIALDLFNPEQSNSNPRLAINWEKRLHQLLVGENDETK
ncbi:RecQ family ATP-dependent DNA helicase [Ornithinibacillus bavariensis]|uniref:ATP-dependent DNA helicase RecQ n=1 Tax=Ornithinibacillus bavariensis TaxID=545502 RepID=A0A920C746_9BACI|nr:RecQ family ATP-dependent DNA helicase [Ornithinibacillus bavariensis]GIO28480.1 ATP-dependent DNA helicase RecQ [Ornithinibacillus bavariensis]